MNNNVIAVIVTYNVGNEFLNSIKKLHENVGEIVVVDNGSKYETLNMLETLENKIKLIKLNENKGIAYALNRGVEYGIEKNYEWILTLDHDSTVNENMISNMISEYNNLDSDSKKKVVMITPVHVEEKYNNEKEHKEGTSFDYVLTEITSGALTKASYYKNNMYDESLFIDLVDHDFCLNINKQGYKIIQVKSAILIHNLGESKEKNIAGVKVTPTNHSALRRYYMTRNRLYIWEKYKEDFSKWILVDKRRFLTETIKVVIFEKEKAKKLKMTLTGIKDYRGGKKGCYHKHH